MLKFSELTEEQAMNFCEAVKRGVSDNGTGLPDDMTDEWVREAEKMYSESVGEAEDVIHIKEHDCIYHDKHEKWLYEHEDGYRYILGRSGRNPLICFGINPSDAKLIKEDGFWYAKPDPTMCRVRNISEMLGFDGYIMLNLYPLINKNPGKLKQIDKDIARRKTGINLKYIKAVFEKYEISCILWACWGTSIVNNDCLINSLQRIDKLAKIYGKKWKTIKWTKAEPVHPHHPLRISNDEVWEAKNGWEAVGRKTDYDVDMEKYISIL